MTNQEGRLVTFEGGESVGKSTQAALLAAQREALLTFEPGDTELGGELRRLLLSPEFRITWRSEALLMAADRAQHVEEVIRPALLEGTDVVCDRYAESFLAYQGFGRELDLDFVRSLTNWATGGIRSDLVLLLDISPERARVRTTMRQKVDRFEVLGLDFHLRVREGYKALAAEDSDRWVVIDADRPPNAVSESVWRAVSERLGW